MLLCRSAASKFYCVYHSPGDAPFRWDGRVSYPSYPYASFTSYDAWGPVRHEVSPWVIADLDWKIKFRRTGPSLRMSCIHTLSVYVMNHNMFYQNVESVINDAHTRPDRLQERKRIRKPRSS